MDFLAGEGRWLRDNLHTHTSRSDGRYTPEASDTWVRVEGIDAAGKRVWSNYIELGR